MRTLFVIGMLIIFVILFENRVQSPEIKQTVTEIHEKFPEPQSEEKSFLANHDFAFDEDYIGYGESSFSVKEITIRHTDSGDKQLFDQTRDMDVILDVLKKPGKMLMPNIGSFADYFIQVHLTDNTSKRFDIWMNEDYAKGMLMDISNSDVVYELPKEEVDKLRGIIKN